MKPICFFLIFCVAFSGKGLLQAHLKSITEQDVRARTVAAHLRLFLTETRINELKEQYKQDTVLQRYVSNLLSAADDVINRPPMHRVIPDGLRLLATSRDCLGHILTLGTA